MSRSKYSSLFVVCILLLVCLLPILRSGLYSDDLKNFETRASIKHIPKFDFVGRAGDEIEIWKNTGRYNPAALLLQTFVFDQFKSVVWYKSYILFCNLLAVFSFCFLLYTLVGSVRFITLFLFFFLAEIQFRIQSHDAFTSLNGLYPLFVTTVFFSIAFILAYLNGGRKYFYILSVVFATAALLFLEIGIILIPLYLIVIFFSKGGLKKKLIIAIPPFTICFIYVVYVLYLRDTHHFVYSGIQANFNRAGMLHVLKVQLFSALPFSNLYKQKAIPELLFSQINKPVNLVSVILIIAGGVYLVYSYVKSKRNGNTDKQLLLLLMAIVIFLVPAIILMPAVKYQSELWLGAGYLPVYVQNFGVALFFTLLANYCLAGNKRLIVKGAFVIFASGIIMAALCALLFNSALIEVMNYNRSYPAEATRHAIESGILSSVPAGSNIVLAQDYLYHDEVDYASLLTNITTKNFQVYELTDTPYADKGKPRTGCFLLDCNPGDTIYTRIYKLDCNTGVKEGIIATDTVFHNIRLSEVEEPILMPRL